jgi:hypothetical protein
VVDYNSPTSGGVTPSAGDGGGVPAAPEAPMAGAPEPGPANPARSEKSGWYDSPSNEEMVRGEIEPDGPQGAEPVEDGGSRAEIAARVYQEFKAEGVTLDAKGVNELNRLIDHSIRDGQNFDHQSFRDGLIKQHVGEMKRYADEMAKNQRKVWNELNTGWKNDLRRDPELGGRNLDTSLSRAKAVLEDNLSPADVKALLVHADNNGMGNFPPFIRLLNNIGKKLNVFEDSIVSGGRAPAPARGSGNRGWYDR